MYTISKQKKEGICMSEKRKEENIDIRKMYLKQATLPVEQFKKEYNIHVQGLTTEQVEEGKRLYGENQIKQAKPKQWYHYLFASLFSPFNIILLCITAVLCYTDIYLTTPPSYANIIVILLLITVSTLLEFFEVFKSNKAAEKLKNLVATNANVMRNIEGESKEVQVPLKEIVVGDIVVLTAGSIIPADLRIIEANDLYITQSSLTGESDSVRKNEETQKAKEDIETITDLDTICFTGTNVTNGYAKGVVIYTGENTYFGKVADTIAQGKPKTSFTKGIENISKLLIRFMLVMIPIVFFITTVKHGDILTAFTFSVAIAIGITPLLLPVILSSSLAKGAVRMSKKKTIIKKLDSIQSFGAMNILCTDKTGTLTEDKIVLEKYLDIKGVEDKRILKHVYLNAYFQTGLRGNIDEAIIARAEKEGIADEIKQVYQKIDEIPFDFTRRRLSVVVTDGTKKQLITKGAIEEILGICTMVDYQKKVEPMTNEMKNNIKKIAKELNKEGLRVLGVCQKNTIPDKTDYDVQDESKMVLIGFIAFLDPPKESAKEAIEKLGKHGIRVMVLTGDNEYVTKAICEKVGINTKRILLGGQMDKLSDMALQRVLRNTNVFAKLSPIQKARIVRLLEDAGNVVGYMGDGINDSPPLTNAEVGISVDTAVDIAKETADIILLEKDLNVLEEGVIEGRKTFGNLLKYIKMAVSFNFGEVLSVVIASIFLPFFPITPIQLLVQSLLYDIGQLTLPLDNVDPEYTKKPRKWNLKSIQRFMLFMGPTSSIFDLIVFATLWFGFGFRAEQAAIFQTVWFSYGVVSNLVGLHIIRTAKLPFIQSNAAKPVYAFSIALSIVALIVPFTIVGKWIGLVPLTIPFIGVIIIVPILYCIVATFVKKLYIQKYGDWI